MKDIELLAPAGDLERLKVNLLYGADAIYFGGEKYGMRANAVNFTLPEIKEACLFAHNLSKKVCLQKYFYNRIFAKRRERLWHDTKRANLLLHDTYTPQHHFHQSP